MRIFIIDDQAFIEFGSSNYLLCIGSKQDVEEATPERLVRMIWEAVAVSKYRDIETWKNLPIH